MFEYSLLNLVSVFHFSFQIELDSEQGSEQGSRSRIKTKIVNFDWIQIVLKNSIWMFNI